MKRTSIGNGVYKDPRGKFWVRPHVGQYRSWRKLKALTQKHAVEEARALYTDHNRAQLGLSPRSPFQRHQGQTFAALADAYVSAGCPDRRLQPRHVSFCTTEIDRLAHLREFFGTHAPEAIRLSLLPKYREWRAARVTKAGCTGNRAVDLELVTLSNVLSYAVATDQLAVNAIRTGRPKFQSASAVKHSRERTIETGDQLNALAQQLFQDPRSEVMGWLLLFSAMTGCRNTELRSLRTDAQTPGEPGYIDNGYLFIRRAKSGLHPYLELAGDLGEMVESFRKWHQKRFPDSPWFFPGRDTLEPVGESGLHHALKRACQKLNLPHCAPHGLRSFYVTKRRSDGAPDVQIAAEIGDQTVALISETYGDVPPNWLGRKCISFRPTAGEPVWKTIL